MITPKFSLTQDADFIYVNIHAPHLKIQEADCHIEEDEVYFSCHPYYLRLHLPGNVLEDHRSTSSYDVDSGWLDIGLPKETAGEHFENLEMLTQLLTPKPAKISSPEVEVIKSEPTHAELQTKPADSSLQTETPFDCEALDENEPDWFIEQTPVEKVPLLGPKFHYGFALQKSKPLNQLVLEVPGMIDIKDPDLFPDDQRIIMKEKQEQESFNCEHYLADLFDNSFLQDITSTDLKELLKISGISITLSDKQQEKLLQLPRREYLIEDSIIASVYLGLVDILLAYAFDIRQTQGEHSVESDWTICKLSSSLSWLVSFTDLKDVVRCFGRRCLCYPLYRNWKLFKKVISDVKCILCEGKSMILKCLLDIHSILSKSETHFPLVEIFLTDYCVWIQTACPKKVESLSKALSQFHVSKDDMGFSLTEMEADAEELMHEYGSDDNEDDSNTAVKLASALSEIVTITNADDRDVDDSDDSTSTSCNSSSSSDEDSSSESEDTEQHTENEGDEEKPSSSHITD